MKIIMARGLWSYRNITRSLYTANNKQKGYLMPNILSITIVRNDGADRVFLKTDLPPCIHPFDDPDNSPSMSFEVARGRAESYVAAHFQSVPVSVIDVHHKGFK